MQCRRLEWYDDHFDRLKVVDLEWVIHGYGVEVPGGRWCSLSKLLINHLFSRRSGMRHVSKLLIHLWWLLHSGTCRFVAWSA